MMVPPILAEVNYSTERTTLKSNQNSSKVSLTDFDRGQSVTEQTLNSRFLGFLVLLLKKSWKQVLLQVNYKRMKLA